jgi:hypothetical protein
MQKLNIKMENYKSKFKNLISHIGTENTEKKTKKEWPRMNTETHRLKKLFCCFNKKSIWEGKDISIRQYKLVANSGVLGWVLKTQKENSELSVVKKSWVERGGLCVFLFI